MQRQREGDAEAMQRTSKAKTLCCRTLVVAVVEDGLSANIKHDANR